MIWEYRDILGQTIIYKNLVKLKNLYESRRFFLRDFCSSKCLNTPPPTNTPHSPKKKKEKSYTAESIVLTRFGSNIPHIKIDEIYTFFGLSVVEMF